MKFSKRLPTRFFLAWMAHCILAPAYASPPPETIAGTPGSADARALVHFTELKKAWEETTRGQKLVPRPVSPAHKKSATEPVPEEAAGKGSPKIPSPSPASSFLALDDNLASIPPDTHGAVGPNHLMTTLNTQVRIQNRSGGILSTVSLDAFWASLGNPDAFDPKVVYDPYHGRWISTAVADGRSTNSSVLVGVSATSDPTGSWFLYKVKADAANVNWADFTSLGFNRNWIVVSVNMFPVGGSSSGPVNIYAFNKTNLYANGTGTFTLLQDTSGSAFTIAPAVTHDTNLVTQYLIEDWDNGAGRLRLSTITGSIGAEILTKGTSFPTTTPWNFGNSGDFLPQLGITRKIDGGDARIQNLVYRNGRLWTTHTIFLPATTPTRTAVQWWQINTNGTVQQVGRIDGGSSNTFYAYPSIAVNKNNDALLGYSRFSSNQYPSANYSFRFSGDSANTFRDDTLLKAGESPYFKTLGGADNRWGDYSATVVDPVDDTTFWTIQEYAATANGSPLVDGNGRWGTWWGRIDAGINLSLESTTLVNESCVPTNGAADPGETVTFSFALKNIGGSNATNVTATLLASSSILSPSGTQSYGNLPAGGTNVARSFSFTANGICGDTARAVLSIQVSGTNLGTFTNTFQLGKPQIPLAQNFDGVTTPALPSGWTASASGVAPWGTSTAFRDTLPNAAFAANASGISSNRLTSPAFPVATTNAQLTFAQKYDLEQDFDGGVLEISIDAGAFGDFIAMGGSFITNGYNGTLPSGFGNPLGARPAWTGDSGGFVTTTARLPGSAAGKQIQLRWICGTDNSAGNTGWYVDSVLVTDGFACCGTLVAPTLVNILRNGSNLNFSFLSAIGQSYTVEYKNSLSLSNWTTLQNLLGDGTTKMVSDSLSSSTQRFYRLRSP